MGTIIAFPAAAMTPRSGTIAAPRPGAISKGMAQVVILPVVRIERITDETNDSGPDAGAAPGRRRKRRARS